MTIKIKAKNKGKFTAYAKAHGKSVAGAASTILAHKENYSATLVRRAAFAKAARKWKHFDGGLVQFYEGGTTPRLTSSYNPSDQLANTIQQTQKQVAGMIPGASIVSPIAGAITDMVDKKDEYGVSKAPWRSGFRAALDPSKSLSRGVADLVKGNVDTGTALDFAFPIAGEVWHNAQARKARDRAKGEQQNLTEQAIYATMNQPSMVAAYGGFIPGAQPNIEAEGGEVAQGPDGSVAAIKGPKHEQGGVPLAMQGGSRIFSDRIVNPETGNTFAEDAEKLMKMMK